MQYRIAIVYKLINEKYIYKVANYEWIIVHLGAGRLIGYRMWVSLT